MPTHPDEVPAARYLGQLDISDVLQAVAKRHGVDVSSFHRQRSGLASRDIAAWLVRSLTAATLRDLAPYFGLTHPDSVSNLVRRAEQLVCKSSRYRRDSDAIRNALLRTENRA